MRAELLLKLSQTHLHDTQGDFKNVMISGPHDYVLMEMRKEELKEDCDMTRVTAELVNMDVKLFGLAVKWLLKHGYITGAVVKCDDSQMPIEVDLTKASLTPEGIEFEKRLG